MSQPDHSHIQNSIAQILWDLVLVLKEFIVWHFRYDLLGTNLNATPSCLFVSLFLHPSFALSIRSTLAFLPLLEHTSDALAQAVLSVVPFAGIFLP